MMIKRAQAGVEIMAYLIVLIVFVGAMFYYSVSTSSLTLRSNQAKEAVTALAAAADQVYSLGPGSRNYVKVSLPGGIESAFIGNKTIMLRLGTGAGVSNVFSMTQADVIGTMPTRAGVYHIFVEALSSGVVRIGELAIPKIELLGPLDGWVDSDGSVVFEYNPVADYGNASIASCELVLNGFVYATDESITEGAPNQFTAQLKSGQYSWLIRCLDDQPDAAEGSGEPRALLVDTSLPKVQTNKPYYAQRENVSISGRFTSYRNVSIWIRENSAIAPGYPKSTTADLGGWISHSWNTGSACTGRYGVEARDQTSGESATTTFHVAKRVYFASPEATPDWKAAIKELSITKAEERDDNYIFKADVTQQVKTKDGGYALIDHRKRILHFELDQNLTNGDMITIYIKPDRSGTLNLYREATKDILGSVEIKSLYWAEYNITISGLNGSDYRFDLDDSRAIRYDYVGGLQAARGNIDPADVESSDNAWGYFDVDSSADSWVELNFPDLKIPPDEPPSAISITIEYQDEKPTFTNKEVRCLDADKGIWRTIGQPLISAPSTNESISMPSSAYDTTVTYDLDPTCYNTNAEIADLRIRYGFYPSNDSGKAWLDFTQIAITIGLANLSINVPSSGIITGTYDSSGGTYTDTQASDDTWYWFGLRSGGTLFAYAELTYDILDVDIPIEDITAMNLEIEYCHSGDSGGGMACGAGDPVKGTPAETQDVEIWNCNSNSWDYVGDLIVDTQSDAERIGAWAIKSGFSNYINPDGKIKVRYSAQFENNNWEDSLLAIDWAPLIITYAVPCTHF